MFMFFEREDGLLAVHENGRPVAHIETQKVEFHTHVDGDPKKPKLAQEQRVVTCHERAKWRIHFTGYRFTLAELVAFGEELAAQPE